MTTNKERIELLEAGLDGVQSGVEHMEITMADRMHLLEESLNKLSDIVLSGKQGSPSYHNHEKAEEFSHNQQ